MPNLAASVTMLFNEWPLLDRFAQAAAAGFQGVEVQDPYGESQDRVAERVRAHRLKPVLMNVAPAIAAVPGREAEFRAGTLRPPKRLSSPTSDGRRRQRRRRRGSSSSRSTRGTTPATF